MFLAPIEPIRLFQLITANEIKNRRKQNEPRPEEFVLYAKRPFGGPKAVPAYLSRDTHRVAIANSRLIACDRTGVTFRWKDYRAEGLDRQKVSAWWCRCVRPRLRSRPHQRFHLPPPPAGIMGP
jgi:hypothetical protein